MNSNETGLPQSPNAKTSAEALPDVKSCCPDTTLSTTALNLPEAPLFGLCPKPVHTMSDQEKRQHLAKIRNLRTNFASWRAGLSSESNDKDSTVEPITTGLEDLL